jgi:hypothetical protein
MTNNYPEDPLAMAEFLERFPHYMTTGLYRHLAKMLRELDSELSIERGRRIVAEQRFDRITDPDLSKDNCVMCGEWDCDCFCDDCGMQSEECTCDGIDMVLEEDEHFLEDLRNEDMEL